MGDSVPEITEAPIEIGRSVCDQVMGRIRETVELLEDPSLPREEVVHSLRKNMKRVRAGLRLLSDADGLDLAETERSCRDVARRLSELRDLDVTIVALERLDHIATEATSKMKLKKFRKTLVIRRKALLETGVLDATSRWEMVEQLAHALAALHGLDISHLARDDFGRALRRTNRTVRKALSKVRNEPDDNAFHTLRKKAKRALYQRRMLHHCAESLDDDLTGQTDRLCELLGEQQDLVVLHERATAAEVGSQKLDRWLTDRLRDCRKEALDLASKAYG